MCLMVALCINSVTVMMDRENNFSIIFIGYSFRLPAISCNSSVYLVYPLYVRTNYSVIVYA